MNSLSIMDNELVSGLDQVTPIDKNDLTLLDNVDTVFELAVSKQSPEIATDTMDKLSGLSRLTSLAQAKFCYLFKHGWSKFGRNGTYIDHLEEKWGKHKQTIIRNTKVWEMLISDKIPKEYRDMLMLHPIRSLIPMANLHSQDFEVSDAQWYSLANAPDVTTVNKLIREIKKTPPRKGSLQLELDTDGTIFAWKENKRYYVGFLKIDDLDPVVQSAISRLIGDKVLQK